MSDHASRAAIYVRTAAIGQDGPDLSLDRQAADCKARCAERGYAIIGPYVDIGHSGLKASRPALDRLLRDAETGLFDVAIVADTARLARSPALLRAIAHRLDRAGVWLVALAEGIDTATAEGRARLAATV